jgi:antitoxin component of MazEF toxin-antitoxin module
VQRKIIRVGNSYGIIIPKNILKILDWDIKALEAKIDTKKKELIIRKGK